MQDNMYTRALRSAVEIEGDTMALAQRLRVPQNTLLLWMSGRSQMPVRAFHAVLDYLMGQEANGGNYGLVCTPTQYAPDRFTLELGALTARCAHCGSAEFKRATPDEPVRLTSRLLCIGCGSETFHGQLVAQLADDAIQQSRALAVRTKRAVQRSRELQRQSEETIQKTKSKLRGDSDGSSSGNSSSCSTLEAKN